MLGLLDKQLNVRLGLIIRSIDVPSLLPEAYGGMAGTGYTGRWWSGRGRAWTSTLGSHFLGGPTSLPSNSSTATIFILPTGGFSGYRADSEIKDEQPEPIVRTSHFLWFTTIH